MASEIRVNTINNRSGLGTISITNSGAVFSGVTTFAQIKTTSGEVTVGTGASVYSPATNVLALGTNNAERVRITSSGNVGIGTDSISFGKLQVTQSSDTDEGGIGIVDSTISRSMRLYCNATNAVINSGNGGSGTLILNEGTGRIGIGTDDPTAGTDGESDDLVIHRASGAAGMTIKTAANATGAIRFADPDGASQGRIEYNHPNDYLRWNTGGNEKLRIDSSGNLSLAADTDTYIGHPAADTLTVTTAGGERLRITSTGNVGIGTDNPVALLQVAGTDSTNTNLTIASSTSGDGGVYFYDGSNSGAITYSHSANRMIFRVGGNEKFRISDAGNIVGGTTDNTVMGIDTTPDIRVGWMKKSGLYAGIAAANNAPISFYHSDDNNIADPLNQTFTERLSITSGGNVQIANGNLVFSTAGTGIDFSATDGPTNGTGSSELLDDYEEGSWTPTFNNAGTATYGIRVGRYVKVGNLVYATCHLDIASKNTASGNLVISGLPYTSANIGNMYGVSSTVHGTGWTTARRSLNILLSQNSTTTNAIYHNMTATTSSSNPSITGSDWGFASHDDLGTGNLLFSITYQAA